MARTKDPHAATMKAWETRRRAEHEGLGAWDREGKFTPTDADAIAAWRASKGVAVTDAPIPLPVWTATERGFDPDSEDWWSGNRPIDKDAPVGGRARSLGRLPVKVSNLVATQHVVHEAQIAKIVAAFKVTGSVNRHGRAPTVVRLKGSPKLFIYDGHHRAAAASALGADEIAANVFEIG